MGGAAAHAQKKNPTIVGFKSHHHEESSYTHHRHNRSRAKVTPANKKFPTYTVLLFASCPAITVHNVAILSHVLLELTQTIGVKTCQMTPHLTQDKLCLWPHLHLT